MPCTRRAADSIRWRSLSRPRRSLGWPPGFSKPATSTSSPWRETRQSPRDPWSAGEGRWRQRRQRRWPRSLVVAASTSWVPLRDTTVEGAVARTLAATLSSQGVAVSTTSYHSDGRPGSHVWNHRDEGDHPFDTTLLVISPDDVANFVMDNGVAPFEGRYMIGVWLWDLEQPSQIMSTAARGVHEIWVPSTFSANAVARATDARVARMLLPVQPEESRAVGFRAGSGFTFSASVDYETGFERQNPLGVVAAFRQAFRPGEGPVLAIEAAHADRYPTEHAALVDATADRPDITVRDGGRGATSEVSSAWPRRSCVVSLQRSDGTGLVLRSSDGVGHSNDRDGPLVQCRAAGRT